MRKILAILLTICMLATLVVMPVSAEIVTLTDPNTVLIVPDDGVVFDEIGDSVSFTINVTEAAVYDLKTRIDFTSPVGRQIAPAWYIDDVLLSTGFYSKDNSYIGRTIDFGAGNVWLEAGEHTVKVENFLGEYKVKALLINKTNKAKAEVSVDFETLAGLGGEKPMVDANYSVTTTGKYPAMLQQNNAAADEIHLKIGVRETGFYSVVMKMPVGTMGPNGEFKLDTTLNGMTETKTIMTTGDNIVLIDRVALNPGTYTLDIVKAGANYYYGYPDTITVKQLSKIYPLAVESYTVNGTPFTNGDDTIKRGADTFEIDVNMDMKTVGTVSIKNGDVPVAAEVSATEDKIKIALKETLDYATTYTLNISGAKDILDRDLTLAEPISFTTVTEASGMDAGAGTVTVESETLVGNTVTVSGTVKSSAGLPIAGRYVTAKVEPPVGVSYDSDELDPPKWDDTDIDGAFEFSFNLPTEGESGNFTFTVHDEYASATPFEHVFVTETTKDAIINGLKFAEDASDVDEVFDLAYAWGANYPSDLSVLEDADNTLFLNHFVGYEAEDVEDVKAKYDLWLKFETLNQTNTADTVGTILESSEDCAAFGLDEAAIELIVTNKSAFEAEVAALAKQDSLEAYQAEFAEVLNEYLTTEFGKTAVALQASNASGYPGQGATFSYKFASALSDVAKLKIDVVSTSESITIDENSVAVALEGATYDATSIPSGVSVLIEAADALEFDNETTVITVSVTSPAVGSYSIKTSGVVTYVSRTTNYTTNIPETTATLTVTAAPSYSGGGGGGVSDTTKPVEGTKSEEMDLESGTDEPGTTEPGTDEPSTGDFEFNDIDSVDWAAESINSLLDKGIISKSEDGKFNPNNEVTREEFVKMMVVAMGVYDENAASNLSDVDKNEWYAAYVASAEKAGLISGNDDGTFGVGDEISREDMSVIIYRAMVKLGLIEAAESGAFADDSEISDYAKEAVYALKSLGILNGVGDNKFAPQGTATRAMAAKVIYGMLEEVSK